MNSNKKIKVGNRVSFYFKKYNRRIYIMVDRIEDKRVYGHEESRFGINWSAPISDCQ